MMLSLHGKDHLEKTGFALVITLIMVALAAVLVVALLTSATTDRATSKSVADRFQAEVAVQNGLQAAKKSLAASPSAVASATADDTFLVLRADGTQTNSNGVKDAYYFLAKPRAGNVGVVDCYPLFAGGLQTPLAIDTNNKLAAPTPPPVFPINPAQETFGSNTKLYPTVLSLQQPPFTQWQEIRDPNDTATGTNHNLPYQRYTYWVEDLAGYIDANVAGNTSSVTSGNARPKDPSTLAKRYVTTPAELPIFSIFSPTLSNDPGTTGAKSLIDNRGILFTVPTLHQLAPGASQADVTTLSLAAHLQVDSELPLVPYGFGYKDEGDPNKPKLDLNTQVTAGGDPAVQAIATKINDNLPTFATNRKGGLTGQDYVRTIAASMIDYADTNSDATIGVDYRGLDSYPLVSELFNLKWWNRAATLNPSTNTYFVHIEMDTWAELWNMTNQSVSGNCALDMVENLPILAGANNYTFGVTPADVPAPSTVATTYPAGSPIPVSLQPNGYGVYHTRHDVFDFDTGITPPLLPPNTSRPMALTGGTATNYTLKWSGTSGTPTIAVDHAGTQTGVGVSRIGGSLNGYAESSKRWSGGYPGFGYTDIVNSTTSQYNLPGDPRSAFFIQSGQVAIAYAGGSSFWERNNRANITPPQLYEQVKPTAWPDGGHNSAIVTATPSPSPTSDPPSSAPAGLVNEPAKAPVVISNAGSYASVGELGNIYDPGQWNVATDPATFQWTDITSAAQASGKYGGGYQLRIGRPEFTLFDKPGTRAWQLLDLFAAGPRVSSSGLLNINTASRDALRVLGAAVLLNQDSVIQPAALQNNLYPPTVTNQGDKFADAVIAARPFLSTSQLSSIPIAATTTPLFGNPAAWNGAQQPTEWNDAARKEYFAKVLPLASTHSRNFRVFVTGQALDKTGKVTSTVSRVYQVALSPTRDSSGKITSQLVVVTYDSTIPN